MHGSSADSPLHGFLGAVRDDLSVRPSPLEEEVVTMFTQFRSPLLRYLLSLGLDTQDGEEVVQEVFLALFQHLQRGKPRTNLRGWVFSVGHNLALKQRIRNGQRARVHCHEEAAENQFDPAPSPEEHVASTQRQRLLLAIVRALPEADRGCLHLRAEGLRYREIAQVLGMSLGAVALSLGRSLTRLANADGG